MKRLIALFILTALLAPFSAFAQSTPNSAVVPRFIPLVEPDSLMAPCVPIVGDTISVLAGDLEELNAVVTALEWDTRYHQYVIEVENKMRLIKTINRCSSKSDSFYLWSILEEGSVTGEPALVFPDIPPLKTQRYFFKEA